MGEAQELTQFPCMQPIHAPGAIQSFGVLIAFDVQPDGALLVQQVSEVRPSALLAASTAKRAFAEL